MRPGLVRPRTARVLVKGTCCSRTRSLFSCYKYHCVAKQLCFLRRTRMCSQASDRIDSEASAKALALALLDSASAKELWETESATV